MRVIIDLVTLQENQVGYFVMGLPGDDVAAAIENSGFTIYVDLTEFPDLHYDIEILEARLNQGLSGLVLTGPIKTRAKNAKQAVAKLLGYPIPKSFMKTRPRFPGQKLDVHVQKSNNLQLWNEEADALRRYVLIRVDEADMVIKVRVLTGEAIAQYDNTGTLTSKYQAKRKVGQSISKLVTELDTAPMRAILKPVDALSVRTLKAISPVARPVSGLVLTIAVVYERLLTLVGQKLPDPGHLQDRNRGAELQKRVCLVLGLGDYADVGQFPDILSQALELKLQMSPTIDLGLVTPDSTGLAEALGSSLRHCDVRYAIVYGEQSGAEEVLITGVVVSTGEKFFDEFQLFGGLVQNRKLQIPLPSSLFNAEGSPD